MKQAEGFMRSMLKSKIHRATVTDANLAYEGSITIDPVLIRKANLFPFEEVHIYNISNGNRFQTYVIPGVEGAGDICINGAAAHLAHKGDMVIIASYTWMEESAACHHQPAVVFVDRDNRERNKSEYDPRRMPVPQVL